MRSYLNKRISQKLKGQALGTAIALPLLTNQQLCLNCNAKNTDGDAVIGANVKKKSSVEHQLGGF